MLTQQTASAIYFCQENIKNAKKLLEDMAQIEKEQKERFQDRLLYLKDAFGRQQPTLELGVPSGSNGHRIFKLEYKLATIIIEAQILEYKQSLKALNELAAKECLDDTII